MSEMGMTAAQAIQIVESLAAAHVRCWVMGGWGIDALLGEQTRPHHDLDLLVSAADLSTLDRWLRAEGFSRSHEWEENAPEWIGGRSWDTAFVESHPDGRELDIHAVHHEGGTVRLATEDPWDLPSGPLEGSGLIAGRTVPCITAQAQRAMHHGYDLPEHHREDLRSLEVAEGPHAPRSCR